MKASSITRHLKRWVTVQDWRWWRLPLSLRLYVAAVPIACVTVIAWTASRTEWHALDAAKFLILMCCGMISVASTPRIMYRTGGGATKDFTAVWVVPTAILLPPVYAALIPIPMYAILQFFVHRGVVHRTVFSAAAVGLSYAVASMAFRLFPASLAGGTVGSGWHAFTWVAVVAACEILGGRMQYFLILSAVKLSNPKMRIWRLEWNRESLQGLFVELDLAVLITLALELSIMLVIIALPTVLLVRRFLVYPILEAQSRTDAKTGLLNVSTWEAEAEAEISRAVRLRSPLSIALVDIDHFKNVNDTYGHLFGDKVLKAIADALTGQSRDYDRVGRFGGEEFVLLLAQTTEHDACKIAERLRAYVAGLAIPASDRPDASTVSVTISIGVTAMTRGQPRELIDLLAAADSALYHAKQSGRNRVAVAAPAKDMGLDTLTAEGPGSSYPVGSSYPAATPHPATPFGTHRVTLVQTDRTTVSLCLNRLLSVSSGKRRESNLPPLVSLTRREGSGSRPQNQGQCRKYVLY